MKTIALAVDESSAEVVQLPPRRGEATRFKSGAEWRGNRHGRPRKPPPPAPPPPPKSVKQLAREKSIEAIELLVSVMNDPAARNRDRIGAANAILDRAFGKPTAQVEATVTSRFDTMSEQELIDYLMTGMLSEVIESDDV